eukprot:COSAG02_NODE_41465_length_394_cov_1.040678_1_plen_96_part_10
MQCSYWRFRYKLFGDEEHPLLFDGQIFDWEPLTPSSEGRHMLEVSSSDESRDLSLSWDSFVTVGVAGGVITERGGGVGWVSSSVGSKLASRGLDHC